MKICPICGFNEGYVYDYGKEIRELEKKFTPQTRLLIRKIGKQISLSITSENNKKKYWMFLKQIERTDKRSITKGLDIFYKRGLWLEGKGFSYLAVIIKNAYKNSEKRLKIERKVNGTTPPIKEAK